MNSPRTRRTLTAALAVSFVCFIIAGFVRNFLVCLLLSAVLIVCVLFVWKSMSAKQSAK